MLRVVLVGLDKHDWYEWDDYKGWTIMCQLRFFYLRGGMEWGRMVAVEVGTLIA